MRGRGRRAYRVMLLAVAAAALAAPGAEGQGRDYVARGDAALRAGRLARAEALYYAAARRDPRDPEARFALGAYLASRGATRVASVLIEEARRFGGDPVRATELLAPLYARSGEYTALLALPHLRLSPGEVARARWLRGSPSSFAGPEMVRLPLHPAGDTRSLGAITLSVGSDTVRAELDPGVSGIIVDATHIRTPGIRTFEAGQDGSRPAAASRIALGTLSIRNAPLVLADLGGPGRARVGLDWVGRWAATVDLRAHALVLRRAGRVPAATGGGSMERIPVLLTIPTADGGRLDGPWTTAGGGFVRLAASSLRRGSPALITYDPRRGELLIAR